MGHGDQGTAGLPIASAKVTFDRQASKRTHSAHSPDMVSSPDLDSLLGALPGMVALLRADHGFTVLGATPAYFRSTHTDPSIVGRPLFDVFPDNPQGKDPAGRSPLRASLERVVATGQLDRMDAVRYDIRRPASEGGQLEERYWSLVNTPIGTAGSVEFILHSVEEASAKANQKAVEILESITEGFFTLDRQWRFDYVNAEAHRILGVQQGALTARIVWEVYPGLEDTPFWDSYHRSMQERVKTSFTAYYAHQSRWYEVTVFPAPEGISVYFRNVTEHKTLEAHREALMALSERLTHIAASAEAGYEGAVIIGATLQVSRVGYGTVDHDSGLLSVSKDWVKAGVDSLAGVTALRDYGTFIDSLQRGEFIVIGDVRDDPRTSATAPLLEARHARSFVNVPVLEQGRLVAVLFVNDDKVHDWTSGELDFIQEAAARTRTAVERAKAEAVLRDSEARLRVMNDGLAEAARAKDEFLATLGHELRNPLAPIRSALAIQRSAPNDPVLIEKTSSLMERQVGHMVRLIDDLLDGSRLSRGLIDLQLEPVAMSHAVGLAVEACRTFIEQMGHDFSVTLPPEELVVSADPVRITQIITNLLNNAAKFTPRHGKLALSLRREGSDALVCVRDDGIGMRNDMLERVFNMFEQVERSYAQVTGGLGIGLTLVRRLAEAHGGSVSAESPGLGKGSVFTVRLPLAEPTADAATPEVAADVPALQRRKILIADDNEDAAESLAMLLQLAGHETAVVTDGAQAVSQAALFLPDVAILDIGMPILDGLAAARAIRASAAGSDVLLIALSGFGQESDAQRSVEAGFNVHLVKPADVDQVLKAIKVDRVKQ